MRIFPSSLVAAVTGAVVLPVFIWGWHFIERTTQSQVLVVVWGVVALCVPVATATMDFKSIRQRQRELGVDLFRPLASKQDFAELYVPAWIRMGVMAFAALVSFLILEWVGVKI